MLLFLTDEQASELVFLLDQAIRDLSYEIAATDDNVWRVDLMRRRQTVHDVVDALAAAEEATADVPGRSRAGSGTARSSGGTPWTA
ncbi:MAG TPA: hypothetical protein VFN68_11700 [Acidimicrobiales bacterium]|nr:hypothetical protein [Acidimicrobiales bacterium]